MEENSCGKSDVLRFPGRWIEFDHSNTQAEPRRRSPSGRAVPKRPVILFRELQLLAAERGLTPKLRALEFTVLLGRQVHLQVPGDCAERATQSQRHRNTGEGEDEIGLDQVIQVTFLGAVAFR